MLCGSGVLIISMDGQHISVLIVSECQDWIPRVIVLYQYVMKLAATEGLGLDFRLTLHET